MEGTIVCCVDPLHCDTCQENWKHGIPELVCQIPSKWFSSGAVEKWNCMPASQCFSMQVSSHLQHGRKLKLHWVKDSIAYFFEVKFIISAASMNGTRQTSKMHMRSRRRKSNASCCTLIGILELENFVVMWFKFNFCNSINIVKNWQLGQKRWSTRGIESLLKIGTTLSMWFLPCWVLLIKAFLTHIPWPRWTLQTSNN